MPADFYYCIYTYKYHAVDLLTHQHAGIVANMKLIPKAEYEQAKASFIATVQRLMTQHDLTPSDIQKRTAAEVLAGRAAASITMQDLYHYLQGNAMPRGDKLMALAKVFGVSTSTLVPTGIQASRVSRRRLPARANTGKVDVVPMPDGKAHLTASIHCPSYVAHKVAAASARLIAVISAWDAGNPHKVLEEGDPRAYSGQPFKPTQAEVDEVIKQYEVELDTAFEQDLQRIQ